MAPTASTDFFPYARDRRWAPLFTVLRVGPDDGVVVGERTVRATFGWVSVETPLRNVAACSISGPHRWWTAVGLRLSFADDGLTFGTDHRRGVCIEFVEKIPRVIGWRDHSALWVSVADCDGLVAALDARR